MCELYYMLISDIISREHTSNGLLWMVCLSNCIFVEQKEKQNKNQIPEECGNAVILKSLALSTLYDTL